MAHHVTGIFSDTRAAERAVQALVEGEFEPDEISIVVTDRAGQHQEAVEHAHAEVARKLFTEAGADAVRG